MAMYLLLRSNKQSGPYSLEELISKGLKPYDLVWVEGKSAAWRYPSEVNELKPYAPAVEEQPYDRFFKKPQKENSQQRVEEKVAAHSDANPVSRPASLSAQNGRHSVFVSLPGNEKKGSIVNTVKSVPGKEIKSEPLIELKKVQQHTTEKENPVKEIIELETKYEQSLDEMKMLYRQTMIERRNRTTQSVSVKKLLGKAAVFFYILALGVLIGLTIMQGSRNSNPSVADYKKQNEIETPSGSTQENQNRILTGEPGDETLDKTIDAEKDAAVISGKNAVAIPSAKRNATQNEPVKETIPEANTKTPTETEAVKTSKTTDDQKTNKAAEVVDILKLVSVQTNDYKRGAFGGIKNLQLTVSNESKYILDQVKVEVLYLKPSEEPLITETVEFKSVAPNGTLTIKMPDNSRGIKVLCRVLSVKSLQYENAVAGL